MIGKKSFGFLEIIAVLVIIGIFYSTFLLKFNVQDNQLEIASNRLLLYLKYTRTQAMIDEQYDSTDPLWHKKRWTLKFLRCKESVGGLYYSIYSDTNKTGQIAKQETLKDPLTNKYIYSDNSCEYKDDRSKYVLLTKEFGINKVDVSCNETQSLGQLSFGSRGELYSKLSDTAYHPYDFEVNSPCTISMYNDKGDVKILKIEPKTGFIEKISKI
jgi:type II secretory pathway pseudopilin PulG